MDVSRRALLVGILAWAPLLAAQPPATLSVPLSGVTQAQVADTGASGSANFSLNFTAATPLAPTLTFTIQALNLSGSTGPTAAHIHRGAPQDSGPVVLPLPGNWTASGAPGGWGLAGVIGLNVTAGLNQTAVVTQILADPNSYYVNVHTETYPNGAIRGQLSGINALFRVPLRGVVQAQQGDRVASGSAELTLYSVPPQFRLDYTISTLGLSGMSPPTAAHIHQGGPNVTGPVAINFTAEWRGSQASGWSTRGSIANTDALLSPEGQTYSQVLRAMVEDPNGFYVNVHTEAYPNGAIRGQVSGATGNSSVLAPPGGSAPAAAPSPSLAPTSPMPPMSPMLPPPPGKPAAPTIPPYTYFSPIACAVALALLAL